MNDLRQYTFQDQRIIIIDPNKLQKSQENSKKQNIFVARGNQKSSLMSKLNEIKNKKFQNFSMSEKKEILKNNRNQKNYQSINQIMMMKTFMTQNYKMMNRTDSFIPKRKGIIHSSQKKQSSHNKQLNKNQLNKSQYKSKKHKKQNLLKNIPFHQKKIESKNQFEFNARTNQQNYSNEVFKNKKMKKEQKKLNRLDYKKSLKNNDKKNNSDDKIFNQTMQQRINQQKKNYQQNNAIKQEKEHYSNLSNQSSKIQQNFQNLINQNDQNKFTLPLLQQQQYQKLLKKQNKIKQTTKQQKINNKPLQNIPKNKSANQEEYFNKRKQKRNLSILRIKSNQNKNSSAKNKMKIKKKKKNIKKIQNNIQKNVLNTQQKRIDKTHSKQKKNKHYDNFNKNQQHKQFIHSQDVNNKNTNNNNQDNDLNQHKLTQESSPQKQKSHYSLNSEQEQKNSNNNKQEIFKSNLNKDGKKKNIQIKKNVDAQLSKKINKNQKDKLLNKKKSKKNEMFLKVGQDNSSKNKSLRQGQFKQNLSKDKTNNPSNQFSRQNYENKQILKKKQSLYNQKNVQKKLSKNESIKKKISIDQVQQNFQQSQKNQLQNIIKPNKISQYRRNFNQFNVDTIERAFILKNLVFQDQKKHSVYPNLYRSIKNNIFKDNDFSPKQNYNDFVLLRPQFIQEFSLEHIKIFKKQYKLYMRPGLSQNLNLVYVVNFLSNKNPYLITRLFQNKSQISRIGLYSVWLCVQSQWQPIIIDDYFPCNNKNKPQYCYSQPNQLWALILEKAFAKACGSYKNIKTLQINQIIKMLTGAPTNILIPILQKQEKHIHKIRQMLAKGCIIFVENKIKMKEEFLCSLIVECKVINQQDEKQEKKQKKKKIILFQLENLQGKKFFMRFSELQNICKSIIFCHIYFNFFYSSHKFMAQQYKLIHFTLRINRKSRNYFSINRYNSFGPCRLILYQQSNVSICQTAQLIYKTRINSNEQHMLDIFLGYIKERKILFIRRIYQRICFKQSIKKKFQIFWYERSQIRDSFQFLQ